MLCVVLCIGLRVGCVVFRGLHVVHCALGVVCYVFCCMLCCVWCCVFVCDM